MRARAGVPLEPGTPRDVPPLSQQISHVSSSTIQYSLIGLLLQRGGVGANRVRASK